MGKSKNGLLTKVVTVFDNNSDETFDVYITYKWINHRNNLDTLYEDLTPITKEDIEIINFESDSDEEIPFWVDEDLVYDSLIEELEINNDEDGFTDEDENYDYEDNW